MNKEQNIKEYVFANWGEKVWVIDYSNKIVKAVITEFDVSDKERDTKVYYKNGRYDWVNRDEIEKLNQDIERESIKIEEDERITQQETEEFCCTKCNETKTIDELKYSDEDSLGNEVQYCKTCVNKLPDDGDSYRDNLEDR